MKFYHVGKRINMSAKNKNAKMLLLSKQASSLFIKHNIASYSYVNYSTSFFCITMCEIMIAISAELIMRTVHLKYSLANKQQQQCCF